jgi:hypothetical protein
MWCLQSNITRQGFSVPFLSFPLLSFLASMVTPIKLSIRAETAKAS